MHEERTAFLSAMHTPYSPRIALQSISDHDVIGVKTFVHRGVLSLGIILFPLMIDDYSDDYIDD